MTAALMRYFVGVDGGGTRCRVRVRTADGDEIGFNEGGPANIHIDPERALETVQSTLSEALRLAGISPSDHAQTSIGLGMAGIVSSHDGNRLRTSLSGFGKIGVESDAATACIGAHGGKDGGLVIAGTGSAGFAIIKGMHTGIGGRGFAIGDEGSAARIGWEALRRALLAAEDLGPSSRMTTAIMQRFDHDPAAVTRFSASARSTDYGALAPLVFGHALKGDAVALPIIKQATTDILNLYHALCRLGCGHVALVGGLSEPLKPFISLVGPDPFMYPLHDAADGAILLMGGKMPGIAT
jgi:glucosamine kinase